MTKFVYIKVWRQTWCCGQAWSLRACILRLFVVQIKVVVRFSFDDLVLQSKLAGMFFQIYQVLTWLV